jgi:GAF domain-containing protein
LYKETGTLVDNVQRQIFAKARQEALAKGRPTVVSLEGNDSERKALVAPIYLQGKPIGDFQLHASGPNAWTEDDLAVIETVLDQLAQTAENLRLFDETREQASFEQLVGEITQKLRQAPTMEILVKTAAEELSRALGTSHSVVKVGNLSQGQTAADQPVSNRRNGKPE